MEQFLATETLIIELLLIVSLVAIAVRLTTLLSDGVISERVYEELVAEVDAALTGTEGTPLFDAEAAMPSETATGA